MAKKIESYNASYPLAYYEVGTVYSFYGHAKAGGKIATDDQIKRYSPVLRELAQQESSNAIKPVNGGKASGANGGLNRYYGVVVNKANAATPKIEIMFLARVGGHNEYGVRAYAVSCSCSTDGKDLMPVSTSIDGSGMKGRGSSIKKGGITLDEGRKKKGGITLDEGLQPKARGVGGITLDDGSMNGKVTGTQSKSVNTNTASISRSSAKRVGGITLDE